MLISQEWVDKAEGDFNMLNRELRARKAPSLDGACFHAQQCAEKYLKARLVEAGLPFPKSHDLTALLSLVLPIEPFWTILAVGCGALTDYAVIYRYPGETADRNEVLMARKHCRLIRSEVRKSLGLPE